jgi:tripartite-type tricarboxylate transporter receptor subunit TctC
MKLPRRKFLHLATGAAALPTVMHVAWAQEWPTRPVTMVVPYAAGGPLDTGGRIVAPVVSERLGQQVIVENVVGAGGMNGAARVAKAAPDGYQFVLGNSATHAQNQSRYKRPMYNPVTDFSPVTVVYNSTAVLIARKDFPAKTLGEFITYVKANQANLQYGSGGAGAASHTACVLLNSLIGVSITHVPYRGAAPAMQDLVGGRIDYMCNYISTSLPQIEAGAVKPIALLAPRRSPALPDLATAHEQGLNDFDADVWTAFFLPKGTPSTIVHRLARATSDALDTPAVRQRFAALGLRVARPEERMPDILPSLSRLRSRNGRGQSRRAA